MIDIVVPYVNPNDPNWQKLNAQYKACKGDNSKQRTRDIDIFKYFFRGIAKNCKWVRKIHLLVQSQSQIPTWLNTEHPKIHVVYHEEYIPPSYLPTFNTFVIEAFFHLIPDLSEHFITCNDDFFFVNETFEEDFFKDGLPVDNAKLTKYLTCNPIHDALYHGGKFNLFQNVLKSSQHIEKQITGKCPIYYNFHTPFGLNKTFLDNLWEKHYKILLPALQDSKFRREYNFVSWLYRYIRLDKKLYVKSDVPITDYSYRELGVSTMQDIMHDFIHKKVVVLNDMLTEQNEAAIKTRIHKIFNVAFPNKSEFEK